MKKRWDLIGLAVLAAVTGGVVAFTFLHQAPSPPASAEASAYYSNPPTPKAAPTPAPVAPAVALLRDKSRPWTLQVVGDSTGSGPTRWVHILAERMSQKYDRPVEIHDWLNDTNRYKPAVIVGDGAGAPIVIWNGSASGKGTPYSLANWGAMVTKRPDLFVINHGLNMPDASAAISGVAAIIGRALGQWPEPPAFALTVQSPRLDKAAATEDAITAALRNNWAAGPVALIDVYKAFKDAGNVESLLLEDRLHPSAQGADLWADTVQESLGL